MKIITHGGQAHADEVLAVALILIKEGKTPIEVQVVRTCKERRARDWRKDGADFVVDVGGDYDPRKGWFDHHQFPNDAKPCCSFTLVARKYKVDLSFFDWARKLAVIDSKGPAAWFKEVVGRKPRNGHESSLLCGTGDSFFVYLANMANKDFDKAVRLGMEWLNNEFREAQELKDGLARSLKIAKIVKVGNYKMAFYDQKDPRGSLAATDKLMEKHKGLIVAAMRDQRGDGYSAVRMNDDKRVDFSKREKDDGCVFAHKNGFVLKWKDDWDGFVAAVARSIKKRGARKRPSKNPQPSGAKRAKKTKKKTAKKR